MLLLNHDKGYIICRRKKEKELDRNNGQLLQSDNTVLRD